MDIIILADFCGRFDGTGNNRFVYLADGTVTECSVFKAPGTKFGEINASGDRLAYFSVVGATEEEMHRKHAEANARIRAIGTDGKDLIRHDLIEKFDRERV